MAAAKITVRALDQNGDTVRGGGQANFLTDLDAVAQIIGTRLRLLQGEWWENLNYGTPIFQDGFNAGASATAQTALSLVVQQRILSTPYVQSISNVQTAMNRGTRAFAFACTVQTAFGSLSISSTPGSAASLN